MKSVTVPQIAARKKTGEPVVMVTCYDAMFAKLTRDTDVDILLVGDSLGMTVQGNETTIPVTLDEVIYHTRCVSRGHSGKLIVADLPFLSYQASEEQALLAAGRCLKEGGAHAVKMEGGEELAAVVQKMNRAGIPVMGHIGLKPQQIHQMGGYKIQGKTDSAAQRLLHEALILEEAGCFAIVLEGIVPESAKKITDATQVPTIGIASGPDCDGQVLVLYDLLGFDPENTPGFVTPFLSGGALIREALQKFAGEVKKQTAAENVRQIR